jgi:ABC-2 type transport system ATP-binding protein
MTRAPVIILDEPTAGLDRMMVQAFRETVDELKQRGDTTILLSSHVLAEVEETCDRIGLIRGGRIVAAGTLDDLKRDARRRVTVSFAAPVGSPPAVPDVSVIHATADQWVLEVRGPLGPVVAALAGLPVRDISVDPFRLEDYISQFYGGEAR